VANIAGVLAAMLGWKKGQSSAKPAERPEPKSKPEPKR
jgi:hypothetical protein